MSKIFFTDNYWDSRWRFIEAARVSGGVVSSYAHPSGEVLVDGGVSVDVADFRVHPEQPVVFVISGVHGTELNVGSGVQRGFMEGIARSEFSREAVALVFVHAINPVGSARVSRVNEDNIDLNRNFVDFGRPLPINTDYAELHDALCPAEWEGSLREEARRKLQDYIDRNGMEQLLSRVLKGQYTHADGLFYGGRGVSWSAEIMRRIAEEHMGESRRAAIFDIHSGVGPKGVGEIFDFSGSKPMSPVVDEMTGQLVHVLNYFPQLELRIKQLIEFGTLPFNEVLEALQADNWLMHYGDLDSKQGRQIKQTLYHALNIDEPEWRKAVWEQGRDGMLSLIKRFSDGE